MCVLSGCLYVGPPWLPDELKQPEMWDVSPDSDTITKIGNQSLIVQVAAPSGEPMDIRWLINDYWIQDPLVITSLPLEFRSDIAIHTQYLDMAQLDTPLEHADEVSVKAKLSYTPWVPIHTWEVDLMSEEVSQ
jgi:hypothetical protein